MSEEAHRAVLEQPSDTMKKISFLLLAIVLLSSSGIFAQSILKHTTLAQSQRLEVTSSSLSAVKEPEGLSKREEKRLCAAVELNKLMEQVGEVPSARINEALLDLSISVTDLRAGESRKFSYRVPAGKDETAKDVFFNIRVSFEARPVGGILQTTVELVRGFAGIGMPTRPLAQESMTQSIDEFTPEVAQAFVTEIQRDLTKKIEALTAAK